MFLLCSGYFWEIWNLQRGSKFQNIEDKGTKICSFSLCSHVSLFHSSVVDACKAPQESFLMSSNPLQKCFEGDETPGVATFNSHVFVSSLHSTSPPWCLMLRAAHLIPPKHWSDQKRKTWWPLENPTLLRRRPKHGRKLCWETWWNYSFAGRDGKISPPRLTLQVIVWAKKCLQADYICPAPDCTFPDWSCTSCISHAKSVSLSFRGFTHFYSGWLHCSTELFWCLS